MVATSVMAVPAQANEHPSDSGGYVASGLFAEATDKYYKSPLVIEAMKLHGAPVPALIQTYRAPGDQHWALFAEVWDTLKMGAIPFVYVMSEASAASLASGAHDQVMQEYCGVIASAAQGQLVIIAPFPEASGYWTPYGLDPANFKIAFKKMQDACSGVNALWAWAPNGTKDLAEYQQYQPDPNTYDFIAPSIYDWGTSSVDEAVMSYVDVIEIFTSKPIIIAQTGTTQTGEAKAAWVRDLFKKAAERLQIVAVIYFNQFNPLGQNMDWRIWDDNTVNQGWLDALNSPYVANADTPAVVGVDTTQGLWFSYESFRSYYYGNPSDYPFAGDWNCDGIVSPGLYRQWDSGGYAYLTDTTDVTSAANHSFYFGNPGDIPLAGDFNGDGCDTLSVYRSDEQRFYIINKLGANGAGLGPADYYIAFGNHGDIPFVGDFNGDGVDTIGVYRPSTGEFFYRDFYSGTLFAQPNSYPVVGDWDNDGIENVKLLERNMKFHPVVFD